MTRRVIVSDPGDEQTHIYATDYGKCKCGCGQETKTAPVTNRTRGHVKGQPIPYVTGHNARTGNQKAYVCSCGRRRARRAAKCWSCRYPNAGTPKPYVPKTFEERFWHKIDKGNATTEECWLWTRGTNNNGYGMLSRGGGRGAPRILAHRASWELHNGPIPQGMQVLHTCDTPRCVNPNHLWLGDPKANSDDKIAKGRIGELRFRRLDAEKVRQIRELATAGVSRRDIADRYGITVAHTITIVRRRAWKNV